MAKAFPNTGVTTGLAADRTALTSPFEGQFFYETDTNKVLVYSGSSWVELHDIDNTNAFPAAASDLNNLFSAWTSWTPTLGNITLGNGTLEAKYCQVGKLVFFKFLFKMGSTSTMGADPNFTLPVNAKAPASGLSGENFNGTARILDSGVILYIGWWRVNSTTTPTTTVNIFVLDDPSRVAYSDINATSPMTWATNDMIELSGFYEAA